MIYGGGGFNHCV